MIFTTIGSQLPFDRLIRAVDEVTPELNTDSVIAQIGNSNYSAENITTFPSFSPKTFDAYFVKAELIIAHAGMGTILSALEKGKPIIVMPRLKEYGEHRTEHQLATAKKLEKLQYVYTAFNEEELRYKLIAILELKMKPLHKITRQASDQLISSIEEFIKKC